MAKFTWQLFAFKQINNLSFFQVSPKDREDMSENVHICKQINLEECRLKVFKISRWIFLKLLIFFNLHLKYFQLITTRKQVVDYPDFKQFLLQIHSIVTSPIN